MARRVGQGPRFVFDVSIWLKLALDEPDSAAATALIEGEDHYLVPDLMFAEFCNAIWVRRRAGDLSDEEAAEAVEQLIQLFSVYDVVWSATLMFDALSLAREINHPAYDCFYLAVAEGAGLPLVTADRAFYRAVRQRRPRTKIQLLS